VHIKHGPKFDTFVCHEGAVIKETWNNIARYRVLVLLSLALLAMLAAPWLARAQAAEGTDWLAALDKMPESAEVVDARALGASYVGTIWRGRRANAPDTLVLYHLVATAPGEVPVPHVSLTIEDAVVGMHAPSGAFVGGAPFLFVGHGPGGSAAQALRIFKLAGEPIEVTPSWAGRVERALNSGTSVVVHDERWRRLFAPCEGCGPVIEQVMDWTGIGYRAACSAHAGHFEALLADIAERRGRAPAAIRASLRGLLDFDIAPALGLIQMGRVAEGRAAFIDTIAQARALGAAHFGVRKALFNYWLNTLERHIGPAVKAARADFPCPLTAWLATEADARVID